MPRLTPIDPARAEAKTKALLDGVQRALGATPNLMRTLANAPAALEAYLGFNKALAGGGLSGALRESIALTVAGENGCDYCASAHTMLGSLQGLDEAELARNLAGRSADPKVQAALDFAKAVVVKRGWVSDADVQAVRDAGHDDAAITEIVATVTVKIFSNYFNHVAGTEVDFPLVLTGHSQAA